MRECRSTKLPRKTRRTLRRRTVRSRIRRSRECSRSASKCAWAGKRPTSGFRKTRFLRLRCWWGSSFRNSRWARRRVVQSRSVAHGVRAVLGFESRPGRSYEGLRWPAASAPVFDKRRTSALARLRPVLSRLRCRWTVSNTPPRLRSLLDTCAKYVRLDGQRPIAGGHLLEGCAHAEVAHGFLREEMSTRSRTRL